MGRFTDTKYTKTIDSLVKATKDKINNPYYKFTDKKPTKVTYYRQNREKTTTDEASKDIYQHIGNQSSIKFNKITDFYIYGFERIQTSFNVSDYGLEADEISGNAIILPNTVVPFDGDFFIVSYVKEDLLFKVNHVTSDTLDDGANVYQFEYKLEKVDSIEKIEKQVVKSYRFIINNVGTDFSPLILDTSYDLISQLDSFLATMTSMYQIFFDKNVQNFVYYYNGYYMYDPYMIEFMIRNKLMDYNPGEYIYVCHGTPIPKTFAYDYTKTMFHIVENPEELDREAGILNHASGIQIQDVNSLFVTRLHPYYKVEYKNSSPYMGRFTIFPADVVEHIQTGEYFIEDDRIVYNLLIAYFNSDNDYISDNLIQTLKYVEYEENKEFFYLIPIYIYIINRFIESLMK